MYFPPGPVEGLELDVRLDPADCLCCGLADLPLLVLVHWCGPHKYSLLSFTQNFYLKRIRMSAYFKLLHNDRGSI
jgi:hypothetical protein